MKNDIITSITRDKTWNDINENFKRLEISKKIKALYIKFFDAAFLNDYKLTVMYKIDNKTCSKGTNPCTCQDRSNICLTSTDSFWCQYIYQLSHELCHCTTSRKSLPKKIKWFDEFICCFASFFVFKQIINFDCGFSIYYKDYKTVFNDYIKNEINNGLINFSNSRDFFKSNIENYEKDENFIKRHKLFFTGFYYLLNDDFSGLTFIGKMHFVENDEADDIKIFLGKLKKYAV